MNSDQKNTTLLKATAITKVYLSGASELKVLKGIDLEVARGEIVMIMGPSGAGKSTLLNIIGTLDAPTTGKVWINGEDVFQLNELQRARFRNRHIGFVFQFHYLLPEFTALENVLIPRMIQGNDWRREEALARELLREVGMQDRLHHKPNQLSGGEQQRVAIARALINRPELILADEPTGDLDRRNSEALFDLIIKLNEKYRQTFIIVTHDERFAERAHRIIYLLDGQIEGEKVLREIREAT
ncbi:MAG: ABC transporter ATP-binding protein [Calditrichaeota bacterium]|nr:MAG: ABC transporter ATP-binding protein [Calditrichota bacterium]